MNWHGPEFIVAIAAICTLGWLVNNFIRARHGYALEDEWGGKTALPEPAAIEELRAENACLAERIAAYENRVHALEAIVTGKGFDVAARIEALREPAAAALPPN